MTMTTTPPRVEGGNVVALKAPTLAWALRRAVLAIVILVVSIAGAAYLLYASIDPSEEIAPAAESPAKADHAFSTGRPSALAAPRRRA